MFLNRTRPFVYLYGWMCGYKLMGSLFLDPQVRAFGQKPWLTGMKEKSKRSSCGGCSFTIARKKTILGWCRIVSSTREKKWNNIVCQKRAFDYLINRNDTPATFPYGNLPTCPLFPPRGIWLSKSKALELLHLALSHMPYPTSPASSGMNYCRTSVK